MDIDIIFKGLKIFLAILPWLLSLGGLHIFLYNKYPKYYFFVAKKFSKWRDTNWNVSVSYTIKKDIDFFKTFEETLHDLYDDVQIRFNLANKKQYEFNVFTLIVQYDLDVSQTDYVNVELLFSKMNVTLDTAKQKLKELRKIFNGIERNIDIVDKSYNINIHFTTVNNPFYGLMIQRLGEEHVEYFQCVFPISALTRKELGHIDKTNNRLTVFKEYITINEREYDILEEVAQKCLMLE